MAIEKTIGGVAYRIGKLNAFEQLHLSRKLLPVLASLGAGIAMKPKGAGDIIDAILGGMFTGAAQMLSAMPEADVNFIIFTCMRVVQRREGNDWATMCAPGANVLQYDISLPDMLQITAAVVKENLGNFLPALDSTSAVPATD